MALTTIVILILSLYVLTGIQQSLFHLFWNIFQLKYLIFYLIGAISGAMAEHFFGIIAKLKE